jgi:poly(A) polymerase/tRNA nucleotidyltransferase (CCA-adding enzyme)
MQIEPPAFLAEPGLQAVLAALPASRLVGGCVRDTLAARPIGDIDLATPDPPDAVMRALAAAGLRALPTGLDHGTVTTLAGGRSVEITTLRRDVATDGRHAAVAWSSDWQEDAARRDFTINAMSMTRDGELFDYFGGHADLLGRRVRFVGDPAARIAEDYLRILRFFRFQARYGGTEPDPDAVAAIAAGVPGLARLSAERVWSELKRILAAADPLAAIRLMARLGVLTAILPEAGPLDALAALLAGGAPADPLLRLAALLDPAAGVPAERLRLSGAEAATLHALRDRPAAAPAGDAAALRRLLADLPADILIGRSWLADPGPAGAPVRALLATLPRPSFPLEGRDVLALGLPPGPRVGALLRQVRDWWLDGGCLADATACRAELARLVAGC